MFIQKRVYKYFDNKLSIHRKIESMPGVSNFTGKWIDDKKFIVKKKGPLTVFRLHGDISEVADHSRLSVFITAKTGYILFFLVPVLIIFGGLFTRNILPVLAGTSLLIFVMLFNSANLYTLKRKFKQGLHII